MSKSNAVRDRLEADADEYVSKLRASGVAERKTKDRFCPIRCREIKKVGDMYIETIYLQDENGKYITSVSFGMSDVMETVRVKPVIEDVNE